MQVSDMITAKTEMKTPEAKKREINACKQTTQYSNYELDATNQKSKKVRIVNMFNNISEKYDFLNHFLSFGIDTIWRYRAINMLKPYEPKIILDAATGTGDLAIAATRLKPQRVIGVDISEGMLEIGKQKVKNKKLENIIELKYGDSENLDFPENTFDAAIVAFGVRNFENLQRGLTEIRRVLKFGAPIIVLEFSKPKAFPVKHLYNFYFNHVLPRVSRIFSKDKSAYRYLPQSVLAFPEGKYFLGEMRTAGFKSTKQKRLSFGIVTLYYAIKK